MTRQAPLLGSAALIAALLIGPWVSHPDYSSLAHTISELAGQNMPNAWIMRTGFIGYGLGALLAALAVLPGAPLRHLPTAGFGLGLIGVGLWSAAPIDPTLGIDLAEDRVHSLLASGVGACFAAACAAHLFLPGGRLQDWLGWAGLTVSVAIPAAMLALPGLDGGLQRVMFGISVLWLCRTYMPPHVHPRTY